MKFSITDNFLKLSSKKKHTWLISDKDVTHFALILKDIYNNISPDPFWNEKWVETTKTCVSHQTHLFESSTFYEVIHSFHSVLRQVHSLFQIEFSTQCGLVLSLSFQYPLVCLRSFYNCLRLPACEVITADRGRQKKIAICVPGKKYRSTNTQSYLIPCI